MSYDEWDDERTERGATKTATRVDVKTIPAGRYAIDDETGKLHFYKIDRPSEGRWRGYTFVNEIVGGGFAGASVRYPVRDKARRERILREIATDVEGAMTRYGKELGVCGHCGRELTDEDSRARGIGPVCAGNLGW